MLECREDVGEHRRVGAGRLYGRPSRCRGPQTTRLGVQWLYDWWKRIDTWITDSRPGGGSAVSGVILTSEDGAPESMMELPTSEAPASRPEECYWRRPSGHDPQTLASGQFWSGSCRRPSRPPTSTGPTAGTSPRGGQRLRPDTHAVGPQRSPRDLADAGPGTMPLPAVAGVW
jgi:hypothetical protein